VDGSPKRQQTPSSAKMKAKCLCSEVQRFLILLKAPFQQDEIRLTLKKKKRKRKIWFIGDSIIQLL